MLGSKTKAHTLLNSQNAYRITTTVVVKGLKQERLIELGHLGPTALHPSEETLHSQEGEHTPWYVIKDIGIGH